MRYAENGAWATCRVRTRNDISMRLIQGTRFGNGASVLRSRAPPLSWKRTVSTPWHFSRLEGAGGSRLGHEAQNGIPHPEGSEEKRFQSGPEGGEASGRFQVQAYPPSLPGTPAPRRLANFPRPGCPGRTSPLPFFFFFLFCFVCFFFKTTLTLKATRTQIPKTLNVELSRRITALSLDRWPAHSWLEWTGGTDAETGLETFKASVEDDGESLMWPICSVLSACLDFVIIFSSN